MAKAWASGELTRPMDQFSRLGITGALALADILATFTVVVCIVVVVHGWHLRVMDVMVVAMSCGIGRRNGKLELQG